MLHFANHPEQKRDEMFVSNVSKVIFSVLRYTTKRLGTKTFNGNGKEFFAGDWYPMFISKREMPESQRPSLAFRIRELEELTNS